MCPKSLHMQPTRVRIVRLRHGRWRWEDNNDKWEIKRRKVAEEIFQIYYDTFRINLIELMSGVGVEKIKKTNRKLC